MDTLLHMLGLDADHTEPWRDHYVTSGADPEIDALVAAGLVEPARRPGFLHIDDRVFRTTSAGRAAALAERARRYPPPSRDKRRYLGWLRIADVAPDLTFGEYLRRRLYVEVALA